MNLVSIIRDESGYTLIESIVAMVLLVGVLIPLGIMVGKLMLSNDSDTLYHALRVAQSEICLPIPRDETPGKREFSMEGFSVVKTVDMNGDIVSVKIAVASLKHPDKCLVALQKSFLVYR